MRSVLLSAVVGLGALGLPLATAAAPQGDAAPAKIRVTLPADAQLMFDGEATKMTSAERVFVTPPLEQGKEYHYLLRARYVRGDDTVNVERRITVWPGQETDVSFGRTDNTAADRAFYYDPAAPAASNPSPASNYGPPARAYYYDPSVPFYIAPNLDVPHGGVAPARDNWKPDFSDPFLLDSNR